MACASARQRVGNRRADARTADQDSTFGFAALNFLTNFFCEVRKVHRIRAECANINHLMPSGFHRFNHNIF